jgi:hypothetical protein
MDVVSKICAKISYYFSSTAGNRGKAVRNIISAEWQYCALLDPLRVIKTLILFKETMCNTNQHMLFRVI